MKIYILTLFPEMIQQYISHSIMARAIENNLIEIEAINIRDFSSNKHKKVDDYPYGGGEGMVMGVQPIYDAYLSIKDKLDNDSPKIFLSPKGRQFNQDIVKELAKKNSILLLCGHYEGVDERAINMVCNDSISIGDYVLTGGELGALVIADAVARLVPDVLNNENSHINESFENYLLEHSQYTRPYDFMGNKVPDILLSGHHERIARYRLEESEKITKQRRPDLWEKYIKSKRE